MHAQSKHRNPGLTFLPNVKVRPEVSMFKEFVGSNANSMWIESSLLSGA